MNLLLGMPLLFFLALLPICLLGAVIVQRAGIGIPAGRLLMSLVLFVLGATVLAHLLFAVTYLWAPSFRDHIEPNTAVVAWLYASGQQIYHPLDAAERYAFLYGPLPYIATGLIYKVLGASTLTAKLAGFLCLALTFVGITAAVGRRYANQWMPILIALGYTSLLSLFFKNHSFWSKPDPFMMAAVAFGLFSCFVNNRRLAWMLCGLCLGLAVNAKITGALYFLPLLAWFFERDGFRSVLVLVTVALVVAVVPFLSADTVSLANYVIWLRSAGGHGLSGSLFMQNTFFVLLASIPLFLYLIFEWREVGPFATVNRHKWVAAASVLAIVLVLIAASKPGSGQHHFLPFLPLFAFCSAAAVMSVRAVDGGRSIYIFWAPLLALLIAATVKSTFALYYGVRLAAPQAAESAIADITAIIDSYPDRNIYMGYGDGSKNVLTFYRNILVYADNPYLIDSSAMMDFQLSGLELPQATIDKLLADDTAVWLIPVGQEPFTILNWYYRHQNGLLFDARFRRAFNDNFHKLASTSNYDVYGRN